MGGAPSFAIEVVGAGYCLDGDASEWLRRVLGVLQPELDRGFGVIGYAYHFDGERCVVGEVEALGTSAAHVALLRRTYASLSSDTGHALRAATGTFRALSEYRRWLPPATLGGYTAPLTDAGIADAAVVTFPDGHGNYLQFTALAPRDVTVTPAARRAWAGVGAHLATAWRLRRLGTARALVDGLLAGVADGVPGRELRRGLMSGSWSLVERIEAHGARVMLAHRNDPRFPNPRRLSARQQAIVELAMSGASNKRIATELGIAPGTVGVYLQASLAKLGLGSRFDLLALADLDRTCALRADLGADAFAVALSATNVTGAAGTTGATGATLRLPLSPVEREVALLASQGLSNAAIASRRGTAVRTVANQLASVFGKLEVGSRVELAAALRKA